MIICCKSLLACGRIVTIGPGLNSHFTFLFNLTLCSCLKFCLARDFYFVHDLFFDVLLLLFGLRCWLLGTVDIFHAD